MGKKIKKDDKSPPEDVFDPLLVESRQAATVVLMLDSPEDDVLSKACEAIYKFVDKCDENKKTMLELNTLDALLRLVQHEDRVVHRNACMALAVMAAHPEARKALRKREMTIQCLINLLAPEEDTVVHEFSALGLSYLANDFSCKVTIYEEGGLEHLIRLLGSHDPDVQKNSIETISLMLQDYQSKSAVRELDGFPAILELLKSEYPVIQHLALVALQRATEESENRAALREQEAINKLINFVGRPEWSELHVFAVMVLSNCLEDPECMEQIKENGGLQKLVAFITDTTPPEEEEGKKGKKDKGAAKGKKGKADDAKGTRSYSRLAAGTRLTAMPTISAIPESRMASRAGSRAASRAVSRAGSKLGNHETTGGATSMAHYSGSQETDDKNKGRSEADPIIPTLPEVKEHAARAIARAAKNAENRKILHEQEAEKMLILLLSHEDANVAVAASQALGVMSENLLSRESIGLWEGIEPLIKLTKNDNPDVREAASMALANLTTSNMHNCSEVVRLHGIDPLITMLSDTRELAIANAAVIFTNMAPDEVMRSEVVRLGIINALIEPLRSSNTVVQSKAALAVAAYSGDGESRILFRESSGVEPLVQLLHSGNDDVRKSASWAMSVCGIDEATAQEICKYGGLEILQEVQLSSTRKNVFTDVALGRLLDSNLSAKYALTGVLGTCNLISDGFFDVGQLKPGTKFLSLEDYCKQDLNQKRPILLVNAKPEKPATPLPQPSEVEVTEKSSRSSVTGRGSRVGGRDTKSKSRAQREKEAEKQKEEEEMSQQQKEAEAGMEQQFLAPGDHSLLRYIEEVVERIAPLPTTRDQVIALATYVAEKMGGAIDRGQVANFSWELPLSQLKFDLKSNVVPLGLVKAGIHYHRALLFKTLADRIAVSCSLIRGEYNRAWNEVWLTEETEGPEMPRFPPKAYLVDLIHQPGRLMRADSPDAVNYQKL